MPDLDIEKSNLCQERSLSVPVLIKQLSKCVHMMPLTLVMLGLGIAKIEIFARRDPWVYPC